MRAKQLKREWRRFRHSHSASLRQWARYVGRGDGVAAAACRAWMERKGMDPMFGIS